MTKFLLPISLLIFLYASGALAAQLSTNPVTMTSSGSRNKVTIGGENNNMTESKKRREPAPVSPVEAKGILYEAPVNGSLFGFQQDGGIVIARDSKTQALLWSRRVYPIHIDAAMESDKQDVFISKMTLATDSAKLMIENEAGDTFSLDLSTLQVEKVEK